MIGRALMIQGTGSDVGKSTLVAGLCRAARRRGLSVAPFKPQNMSNNAAACRAGGEIGRAQALQARASGVEPHPDHNPVLLKPQTDRAAQLVVHGRAAGLAEAAGYMASRDRLLPAVLDSFGRLARAHDLVLVEGAGSAAEVNLRARDIANMGFARAAAIPVCLLGDIDRGGVIASLVGTHAVLDPADAAMVIGFLVNKFRGDPALFADGVRFIEERTGWRSFGIVPWIAAAASLPAEDAVTLARAEREPGGRLKVAAPMLSRMANFDDADPLRLDGAITFAWVPPGRALPRDADVIVLFGTKSTLGDLAFLRAQGWDHDILAHARAGGRVLGVCGGMQMLGRAIHDPDGIDGDAGHAPGLGLLDLETVMAADKRVRPVAGACAVGGDRVMGYEIHAGRVSGPDLARPVMLLDDGAEGARSADDLVEGTHVHGLFAADGFRRAWIARAGGTPSGYRHEAAIEAALESLAHGLEAAFDVDALFAAARTPALP